MKVLNQEVTETQYLAFLELAKITPKWNSLTAEYREGVLIGIKARID